MSNLFDAQTKDVIESRMAQTLHTITEKSKVPWKAPLPAT